MKPWCVVTFENSPVVAVAQDTSIGSPNYLPPSKVTDEFLFELFLPNLVKLVDHVQAFTAESTVKVSTICFAEESVKGTSRLGTQLKNFESLLKNGYKTCFSDNLSLKISDEHLLDPCQLTSQLCFFEANERYKVSNTIRYFGYFNEKFALSTRRIDKVEALSLLRDYGTNLLSLS